ncbi:MAG: TraB/GumN family protein [Rheinheimera sp.]|nr:TraB/GumN family protein [Rheinheimera sp.]
MWNAKICASALMLLLASTVQAETSVWRLSDGSNQLFIAGTVHLLPAEQFPLPDQFDQAYQQADTLVFEADVRQLDTPQGMQLLLQQARYNDGRQLDQVLTATTYAKLQDFAKSQGVDLRQLNSYKPDFVLLTLMQSALQNTGMAGQGVDMFFLQQALTDRKALLFLETVEQQLTMLLNASANNEDAYVQQNLAQLSEMDVQLKQIIAAWRSGNTDALASVAMAFTDTPEGKQFYQTLLVQRNQNWIPQLTQMLATKEVELVLVGALHLAGDSNVLELLQQQGYQVTKL